MPSTITVGSSERLNVVEECEEVETAFNHAGGLPFVLTRLDSGEKRALVTTGRVASEEPGMRLCAEWLKTVVKEVPATWIGVGDPYWRPTA